MTAPPTLHDMMAHHREAFAGFALDPDTEATTQRCQEIADRVRRVLTGVHPEIVATVLAVGATAVHGGFQGDEDMDRISPGLWLLGMVAYMVAPAGPQ